MKSFPAPARVLAALQYVTERDGVSESMIIRKALELYTTGVGESVCPNGTGQAAL